MSWSRVQQSEDVHDQLMILVGSALRLLYAERGLFAVSNEAFDPQSSSEYIFYQLPQQELSSFLDVAQRGAQPNVYHPLVIEPILRPLVVPQERCSLFLYDPAGPIGLLHGLRSIGRHSFLEPISQNDGPLRLFIAQIASGIRCALKAQSLVQEQGRLAAIFQHSAEGILTVDNAFRIVDFNPAMERLTGWRESEVLGRFYFEVLRPKDRFGSELGLEDSPIIQAFAGQEVVNREMRITARDGQRFDVAVTASCVRSARGEPLNGILNVRDITRERQQEEQRSTFISVISHELQTPIAIIKGYASTLARSDTLSRLSQDALHTRLTAIEEEADRLNKLVGNLLYASRIQAGGLHMDIAPLDLGNLIEVVARRLQAKSSDVTITTAIPDSLPTVMADRDRIEEVLQNLLDNAIKYSPRQRRIHIAAHATGEEVIVSISDAGMGISLREQEQIFDRFHRVGAPLAQSTPGAGLGLYICKAIVEAHGGHIWVESVLHEGSTFSFSLPREEKAQLPMVVF